MEPPYSSNCSVDLFSVGAMVGCSVSGNSSNVGVITVGETVGVRVVTRIVGSPVGFLNITEGAVLGETDGVVVGILVFVFSVGVFVGVVVGSKSSFEGAVVGWVVGNSFVVSLVKTVITSAEKSFK